MKILYSAGNRPGAGIQLKRFLDNCTNHVVRVAAYMSAHKYVPKIDWTLNALKAKNSFNKKEVNNLFGYSGVPFVDLDGVTKLLDDIVEFEPDLIISDGERISAHIASVLDITLWSCTPLHLIDGVVWEFPKAVYKTALASTSGMLRAFQNAKRRLVYSPFGDVPMRPILVEGFEWVTPYTDLPRKFQCSDNARARSEGLKLFRKHYKGFLCAGETSFVADVIYNRNHIAISPSPDDAESLLNSLFCEYYGLGTDIGKIDNKRYAISKLDSLHYTTDTVELSLQGYPKLHELLEIK